MRARTLARATATVVVAFAAGLAAGEAVERIGVDRGADRGVDRAQAAAPGRAPPPYAGTVPPNDAKVLSSGALADVELTDRHDRAFTLDRMVGSVVVIGFAPTPCDAGCARQVEALRRVHRRLGERSSDEGDGAGAPVEFVLVSDAATALPDVATAPDGAGTDERRWRVARAGTGELAALRERFGPAVGAAGGDRPTVHVLDTRGRLVQRYRADPLDVARLGDDVAWLRDRDS